MTLSRGPTHINTINLLVPLIFCRSIYKYLQLLLQLQCSLVHFWCYLLQLI